MRLIVVMAFALVMTGAPAFAADDACVGCRVSVVKHALRTKGTIDCARDIPESVEERARKALANCEARYRCGTHEAEVLAAIRGGVAAVEGSICGPTPVATDPTPTPSVTPAACSEGGCLRIRCLPDDNVEVLTPTVVAQPDGLHVEVVDPPVGGQVGLQALSEPGVSWWSGSSGLLAPFLRPVPEGDAEVWCIVQPYEVIPDQSHRGSFTIVDPADVFRSYVLECGSSGAQYLDFGYDQNASPSLESAVRAALPGLLASDVVEQAGYVPGDPAWPWLVGRVVRDGRVIGRLDIDGREGWRYRATAAELCADSGLR